MEQTGVVRALTRAVPETLAQALSQAPPDPPIEIARARAQHEAYVAALRSLGVEVQNLPPDPAHPDCCFVEDTVLVAEGVALVARLGAPSRRGEEAAVVEALRPHLRLERMRAPATLDGGDCLRVGKTIFVGQSGRTNAAGLEHVRGLFGALGCRVVAVAVPGVLHLKCVCSRLDEQTVLLAEGTVPRETFGSLRVVSAPAGEAYAANCVAVGRKVLVSAGHPGTERALRAAGFVTIPLDTGELRKADGALTCCSILF